MIASISGTVEEINADYAVIEVGNIGYMVNCPSALLGTLRHGMETKLYTSMIVREDSISLYGFGSRDDKAVFGAITSVNGVGPKLAMAALSQLGGDGIRSAVQSKDEKLLTTIPGVGKKSAQRLILELGEKLGTASTSAAPVSQANETVVEALVSLGWKETEALAAVRSVSDQQPGASTEQLLRLALILLGGGR